MKDILGTVKDDIKKHYYDSTYHGIDLEDRFKKAEQRLDQVTSTPQALGVIAQAVIDFDDSHLYFLPPATNIAVEYGWRMAAVGDKTYVLAVKPGSDAEKKGLKVGDEVISVGGFKLARRELWKVLYFYNQISRRNGLAVEAKSPGEDAPRQLSINSEIKSLPRTITFQSYFRLFDDFYSEENDKHRFQKFGGITVWRMPGFDFDPAQVDEIMQRVKDSSSLILDLRGNGGGYVKTLERLAGFLFDKDLKIADLKGRKKMDPMLSKNRGKEVFNGKLVILVDSRSASASEILARAAQLEKRAIVLGDRSAGAVMQSESLSEQVGSDNIVMFAVSVTNADVIMSDGKSLEHEGVTPDELVVPTAADLAAGRDPVLSRAVEVLGGKVDPAVAGKLFPYYWK